MILQLGSIYYTSNVELTSCLCNAFTIYPPKWDLYISMQLLHNLGCNNLPIQISHLFIKVCIILQSPSAIWRYQVGFDIICNNSSTCQSHLRDTLKELATIRAFCNNLYSPVPSSTHLMWDSICPYNSFTFCSPNMELNSYPCHAVPIQCVIT